MNKHTCYFCGCSKYEENMEQLMVGKNAIFDGEKIEVWACEIICSGGDDSDE